MKNCQFFVLATKQANVFFSNHLFTKEEVKAAVEAFKHRFPGATIRKREYYPPDASGYVVVEAKLNPKFSAYSKIK